MKVTNVEALIKRAANEVRAADAIAIVGAGMSRGPGYPLLAELLPLLWKALDEDPGCRLSLAETLGVPDVDAKSLVGEDDDRTRKAFAAIADRELARHIFQQSFAALDRDRQREASPAHEVLAELIHRGKLTHLVSLNWDSALEHAYERLYGRALSPGVDPYSKPHGDARHPETAWLLPFEGGCLPRDLHARLRCLAQERPRVLLIVGYSEQDETIVQDLISPLERRWQVVRIGPTASGPLDIPLPAEQAMPRLLGAMNLAPETPGWEYVHFLPQRGIGPAVMGLRLGPHDVEACPALPEVDQIDQLLPVTGSVFVSGRSGSGKSITAYHAAWRHAERGWDVIRLDPEFTPATQCVDTLAHLRHKTLAIADDAQSLPGALVGRIIECAIPETLRVLVVTTEEDGPATVVRVPARQSVSRLARAMAQRRAELLPLLHELDPQVGERVLDVPFETRLAQAARENTPWHFFFALRGGWREARAVVASLRDDDRADLCLAALSVSQLITADAGVDEATLVRLATPLGRGSDWLTRSLSVLRSRNTLDDGHILRSPHARFAETAIHVVFSDSADPERPRAFELVRAALRGDGSGPPTPRGVYWLLEGLSYAEGLMGRHHLLVDADLTERIFRRLLAAERGAERGAAALALNQLRRWNPHATELIRHDPKWLMAWLAEANAAEAYGLGDLLNDLYNDDHAFARQICQEIDVSQIADRVFSAASNQLYGWSHFLGRCSVASPEIRQALAQQADESRLSSLVDRLIVGSPLAVSRLLQAISASNRSIVLRVINEHAAAFADSINRSPALGFRDHQDVIWWVLGYGPRFLTRREPDRPARRIAQRLAALVDTGRVATAIEAARPNDWQDLASVVFFLHEALPAAYQSVLDKIDVDRLDVATGDQWSRTDSDLEELLNLVGWGRDHEPARTLIARHEGHQVQLTPRRAVFAPSAIAARLRAGDQLPLGRGSFMEWGVVGLALDAIAREDPSLLPVMCADNVPALARGLDSLDHDDCEAALMVLEAVRRTDPSLVRSIASALDPGVTYAAWAKVYSRGTPRGSCRRAIAALVRMVEDEPTVGRQIAQRLRARFRSLQ